MLAERQSSLLAAFGLQNLPAPDTRAEWPAAAEDASLPDGLPELLLLLVLLGDGATFVVGVAFCALAVVAPANNAAASAIAVRLFIVCAPIVYAPWCS